MKTIAANLPPPADDTAPAGVIYVIGLTQFVIISLGLMALNVIEKTNILPNTMTALALFLVGSGLWLFLIPLCWIILAHVAMQIQQGQLATAAARVLGVAIAVVLGLCFLVAILHPTV